MTNSIPDDTLARIKDLLAKDRPTNREWLDDSYTLRQATRALLSRLEAAEARAAAAEAVLTKMINDSEHLINILEGKAEQEWNYDFVRMRIRDARAAITINSGASKDTRSTLERGNEIEHNYYLLRAQEWVIEPETAERLILASELPCRQKYSAALTANPKDTGND